MLKELKISLDLRYTSSWCAIAWEIMPHLLKLLERKKLVEGALVNIIDCPANLYFLAPFRIGVIKDGMAELDFVTQWYPLERLELRQEIEKVG